MAKKVALGKGIASLIQSTQQEVVAETLKKNSTRKKEQKETGPLLVDISQIKANPNQPRKIFKEKELDELSNSIQENGVIQPLIVSKVDKGFELIAGERRLRAAKRAGLESVPVVVKKVTDRDKMIYSIIENVQRSDLNCVEEALAYYQLMDDFKLTQEEVAKRLGKERSTIANFLRILKLPRKVLDYVQKEVLSFGHAKLLASAKDKQKAIRFADITVAESLSVRELEKLLKSGDVSKNSKKSNPFFDEKLDDFRKKLEQRTGYHFTLKSKKNGAGEFVIKYSNEAEFNDIFEYLLKR